LFLRTVRNADSFLAHAADVLNKIYAGTGFDMLSGDNIIGSGVITEIYP
jgi:hypothetical protein